MAAVHKYQLSNICYTGLAYKAHAPIYGLAGYAAQPIKIAWLSLPQTPTYYDFVVALTYGIVTGTHIACQAAILDDVLVPRN